MRGADQVETISLHSCRSFGVSFCLPSSHRAYAPKRLPWLSLPRYVQFLLLLPLELRCPLGHRTIKKYVSATTVEIADTVLYYGKSVDFQDLLLLVNLERYEKGYQSKNTWTNTVGVVQITKTLNFKYFNGFINIYTNPDFDHSNWICGTKLYGK